MAKRTPKWQKGLDASSRQHLKDSCNGQPTLAKFKRNRDLQKAEGVTCQECEFLARQLGLETLQDQGNA